MTNAELRTQRMIADFSVVYTGLGSVKGVLGANEIRFRNTIHRANTPDMRWTIFIGS